MTGLPRTSSSGLGVVSVSGRMRSPRPAARTIAFTSAPPPASERVPGLALLAREVGEQAGERSELGVALAGPAQVTHDERLVLQVGLLAVAVEKPGEDADDLELALRSHPFEIAVEGGEVARHRQARPARGFPVADGPIEHPLLVPFYVGVAQERHQIVRDRPVYGVLEIEDPGTGLAHHQVA